MKKSKCPHCIREAEEVRIKAKQMKCKHKHVHYIPSLKFEMSYDECMDCNEIRFIGYRWKNAPKVPWYKFIFN